VQTDPTAQPHRVLTKWRTDLIIIALLSGVGLAIRLLWTVPTGFDGFYGQDAYAYSDFARNLALGQPPGELFWPVGYPLILGVGYALFGFAIGQAINILFGVCLSPLVYILSRQLAFDRWSGVAAGLLIAFCGQAVQSSLVVMADISALFLATLSAVALLQHFRHDRAGWLALSAGLLAFAAITRWLYLLLALVWTLSLLLHWRGRIRWRAGLLAGGLALAILIPQMLISRESSLSHEWLTGWALDHATQKSFINVDGTFNYALVNLEFYAAPLLNPYYLSPVFLPLFALGLWRLARQMDASRQLLFTGWLLLPSLFLIGIPYQNIRFPLIVMPGVVILVAAGVAQSKKWRRWLRFIIPLALIVGIAQTSTSSQQMISPFIDRMQADRAIVQAVDAFLPDGVVLYTFDVTLTFQHHTTMDVYEIYYETPETLQAKWIPGQPDYLLLNVWVIENQWNGKIPQTVYHWFRDARGLTQIGRWGYYTLFQVSG
jgi:hypothetical protein